MSERTDVVVVGGGTAGLQAALQLALVGRSVVLLERRPEGRSGARWTNGTAAWQFERAGLAAPTPPELRPNRGVVHMASPSGDHRFTIEDSPIGDTDMRLLVERLRLLAVDAGVDLRWGVSDPTLHLEGGRPVRITAGQGDHRLDIEARLFVDAAGHRGVLRSQVPALAANCPPFAPADLCSAQQLILAVDDADGARRFLKEQGAEAGDAIVSVGIEGGYSTTNISVEESFEEVSVLTGSIPALGHATGFQMLRRIRAEHPWMGETIFGGGGLIPLQRVYDRFTAPGIALVGDAASQVFPGHGSGIGFGLMAGKVLAEEVGRADDPGSAEALWAYQATYLRELGGILGAFDAVRRMSVKLGPEGVETLFASGIFSPAMVRPGLEQKVGALGPKDTVAAARALAGRPKVAKVVVPALAAMGVARALYRTYPLTSAGFPRWEATARRLLPR